MVCEFWVAVYLDTKLVTATVAIYYTGKKYATSQFLNRNSLSCTSIASVMISRGPGVRGAVLWGCKSTFLGNWVIFTRYLNVGYQDGHTYLSMTMEDLLMMIRQTQKTIIGEYSLNRWISLDRFSNQTTDMVECVTNSSCLCIIAHLSGTSNRLFADPYV